jgi:aminoglycoside phosphotransferase (APT) family kinase protein
MFDGGRPGPDPRTVDDESGDLYELSELVGTRVVAAERARWGFSNRTDLVTTSDGSRFAVQRLVPGPVARHRIGLAHTLPPLLARAGIPTPPLLVADPEARPRALVTSLVAGRPGAELLDDTVDAIALGTEMGRLVRRLRDVPTDGLRLPSAWGDPRRLGVIAARWLRRSASRVDESIAASLDASLGAVIDRLPDLFAGRPAILAHGDWAPVNVIVEGRSVVAVLDWEFARLADPLFDVAWWRWIVSYHHPDAYVHAWPAFLETAGIELDPLTLERLHALESLRLLEALASPLVADDPAARARWVGRLQSSGSSAG